MEAPFRFGLFSVSTSERVVRRNGVPVPLAPKAVEVLLALLARREEIVDKRALMELVWPDTFVDEANLTQTIYVLRSFLKEHACGLSIENMPKRGYCLRWREVAPTAADPPKALAAVETAAIQAVPVETLSIEAIPVETVRTKAVQGEAAETEAALLETIAAESVPLETAAVEALPLDAVASKATRIEPLPITARPKRPALWLMRSTAVVAAVVALVFASVAAYSSRAPSLDGKATATYLLAKHYQLGGSLQALERSDALYATLARDYPQNTLGYAGRAETSASLAYYASSETERARLQGLAIELADEAMQRDSRSAAANAALGGVQMSVRHDEPAASASFSRALELDPNEVSALAWQGTILMDQGHVEQARRLFARAVSLSPDVPGTLASLAWSDFLLHDYDEAVAFSKQMLLGHQLVPLARLTLANAYIGRKEYAAARRVVAALAQYRNARVQALALVARVDALTGHERTALINLRRVEATTDPTELDDWDAASLAAAYLALNHPRDAFVWLTRVSATERRQIACDPRFTSLHANPRFGAWVRD